MACFLFIIEKKYNVILFDHLYRFFFWLSNINFIFYAEWGYHFGEAAFARFWVFKARDSEVQQAVKIRVATQLFDAENNNGTFLTRPSGTFRRQGWD